MMMTATKPNRMFEFAGYAAGSGERESKMNQIETTFLQRPFVFTEEFVVYESGDEWRFELRSRTNQHVLSSWTQYEPVARDFRIIYQALVDASGKENHDVGQ